MKGCYAQHPSYPHIQCTLLDGHDGKHVAYEIDLGRTRITRRWKW